MGVYQILTDFFDESYCLDSLYYPAILSMLLQCNSLSLQRFVHATICPCDVLSVRRIFCDVLSATFCPRHYVRDHLSCNELSCDILSMRRFVRNDLSATICPATFCPSANSTEKLKTSDDSLILNVIAILVAYFTTQSFCLAI
jgi:hypothetical protein